MRYLCALLVLALTCACGGGSGSDNPPNNGGNPPPPGGFQQATQDLVEACGQDGINELIDFLALFEPLLNPNSTRPIPSFQVLGIDSPSGTVQWALDRDGQPPIEFDGLFSFTTDMGDPVEPFDLNLLAGGLGPMPGQIANIPDGTRLEILAAGIDIPFPGPQGLLVTFLGGTVDALNVLVTIQFADCGLEVVITDASLAAIAGAVPVLDLEVNMQDGTTLATGTITLDGTNTASVTLTPDGSTEAFTFLVDLTTGVVTPAP